MKKTSNNKILTRILQKINLDDEIYKAKKDPGKYNSTIDEFGITDKLNNIIDDFESSEVKKSSLYQKYNVKIGIICDEFLYYSLKDAADFQYIPYTQNMKVNEDLDILLVVSSWRGLDFSWDYVANPKGSKRESLLQLIRKYNEKSITTIFYSKEDPVSYKEYLSIAKECDYIFTSAREMIEAYKNDTGNQNVDYLEFGVNPLYHNPIGKNLVDPFLNKQVTFAGSWMVRFPERNKDALDIFNGVNRTDLDLCIIDRQYEREMERYHYPTYLLNNISATIPHERLMKLHKATKWGINLNSVKDSETMFANRVYELQSMGNIIISNYNTGVHNKFPNVQIVQSKKEVENLIKNLNFKDQKRLIAKGLSNVMLNHTAYHRVGKLLSVLGYEFRNESPKILVIGSGLNSKKSFDNQSYSNKDYIESDSKNLNDIDLEQYSFISFFSNIINYEEYYIETMLSTFAYTDADVVFMNKNKYNFTDKKDYIKTSSMMTTKAFTNLGRNENNLSLKYFNIPKTEMSTLKSDITVNSNNGPLNISSDEKIIELDDIKQGDSVNEKAKGSQLENKKYLSIIIPVLNDYHYLEYKSLQNIFKGKLSNDIEVIIVTNNNNQARNKVIERMKRKFTDLKVINVEEESASIEYLLNIPIKKIATEYVMFLNPQNQIIDYELYSIIEHIKVDEFDFIYGSTLQNNTTVNFERFESKILNDMYNESISIESLILKKSFLEKYEIKFENDNFGSESYLYKVFTSSNNYKKISNPIHKDFTKNQDLNSSKLSLLEKSLEEEIIIKEMLIKVDAIDEYVEKIFPEKFIKTYLKYFKATHFQDKAEALNILYRIYQNYQLFYKENNPDLNNFKELFFTNNE